MKWAAFRLLDALGVNALFRRLNRGRIRILLYHNIMPDRRAFPNAITPEQFAGQLRYLKKCCNVVAMDQSGRWLGYRKDKLNVLLTFDDGFVNNLENALPVLVQENVSAVFFLIAGCTAAGESPAFAERYAAAGAPAAHLTTLDRDGALALIDAGMTVGSHSWAHHDFSAMDDDDAVADAKLARATLEELLGREIALFAFPWGKHRPGQEHMVARHYARIFTTEHGLCGPGDVVVPRNEVDSCFQLRAAASGALDFLRPDLRRG